MIKKVKKMNLIFKSPFSVGCVDLVFYYHLNLACNEEIRQELMDFMQQEDFPRHCFNNIYFTHSKLYTQK